MKARCTCVSMVCRCNKEKFCPACRQNWKNLEISFLKTTKFARFVKFIALKNNKKLSKTDAIFKYFSCFFNEKFA